MHIRSNHVSPNRPSKVRNKTRYFFAIHRFYTEINAVHNGELDAQDIATTAITIID